MACLTGGLNDGETSYVFYVASRDATPIPLDAPAFLQPHTPLNSSQVARSPAGTAWMPGWTLEARPLDADAPLVRYHFSELRDRFTNFGNNGFRDGNPAAQVTFTALVQTGDGKWAGVALDVWGGRIFPPAGP